MRNMFKELIKSYINKYYYTIISEDNLRELHEKGHSLDAHELRLRLFRQISRKGFIPNHIIDVGANRAQWSYDAHQIFPECAFTLIEPQAEMKPYLDQFCSEVKNARWLLAGAGATMGELRITISPHDDSASRFGISEEWAKSRGLEQRVVPIVTLDSICEESTQPIPEIVKIDAEGFDLEVMRGSQKLMGVTELFFTEASLLRLTNLHTIIEFMIAHGYEPYDFTDFNRRPYDESLSLVEIAFAKRTGVLRDHLQWWDRPKIDSDPEYWNCWPRPETTLEGGLMDPSRAPVPDR